MAFHKVNDSIQGLQEFLNEVIRDSNSTIYAATAITNTAVGPACSPYLVSEEAAQIGDISTTLQSVSDSITSLIDPLNSNSNDMQSFMSVASDKKTVVVFCFFFIFFALLLVNAAVIYLRLKVLVYITNPLLYVFIILSIVLCTVLMILCILLGDFCMDPAENLLTTIGSNSSIYSTVDYFSTCEGTNVFSDLLSTINNNIEDLNSLISSISGVGSQACVNELTTEANQLTVIFQNLLSDLLSCGPLNTFFNQLINEAICEYSFNGFYQTFGLIYFIALFFFVFLCCLDRLYRVMPNFESQGLLIQESEHFGGQAVNNVVVDYSTPSSISSSSTTATAIATTVGGISSNNNSVHITVASTHMSPISDPSTSTSTSTSTSSSASKPAPTTDAKPGMGYAENPFNEL